MLPRLVRGKQPRAEVARPTGSCIISRVYGSAKRLASDRAMLAGFASTRFPRVPSAHPVRIFDGRCGNDRAIGRNPLVRSHLLLQLADGKHQGESRVGTGL